MLLNWDQRDLADATGLTTQTISAVENWKAENAPRQKKQNRATKKTIRAALERAGAELLDPIKGVRGPGAVLKWRDDMAVEHDAMTEEPEEEDPEG